MENSIETEKEHVYWYCQNYFYPGLHEKLTDKHIKYAYKYINNNEIIISNNESINYLYAIISKVKEFTDLMIKYYEICANNNNVYALNELVIYHCEQNNELKALIYFKKALKINPKFTVVTNNMANFYRNKIYQYENNCVGLKHIMLSIANDPVMYNTLESLVSNYNDIWNQKEVFAKKLLYHYDLAIDNGCAIAPLQLGLYYGGIDKYFEMEYYLEISANRGYTPAMIALGLYNEQIGKPVCAIKWFECAVSKGDYTKIIEVYNHYKSLSKFIDAIKLMFEGGILILPEHEVNDLIIESITNIVKHDEIPPKDIFEKIVDFNFKSTLISETTFSDWKERLSAIYSNDVDVFCRAYKYYKIKGQFTKAAQVAFEGKYDFVIIDAIRNIVNNSIMPSNVIYELIQEFYKQTQHIIDIDFFAWQKKVAAFYKQ